MHDRLELPRSHLSRDGCQTCHLMLVPQGRLPVLSLSVMRNVAISLAFPLFSI